MKNNILCLSIMAATISVAPAAVFSHDFSGTSGTNLHGLATTTGSKTWTADSLFKADGSFSNSSNADRGAAIDLGATFFADQFTAGNNTVTLTVTYGATGNSNSFAFAGFSTDPWISATSSTATSNFNTGNRAQGQGLTLGIEYDTIGDVSSSLHRDTQTGDNTTDARESLATTLFSTYTMTILAGGSGFGSSTVTLTDGTNSASISGYNANALRTVYIGVESASGTSTANFDSIQLAAIPEPSAAALGAIGVLLLIRRRR